MTDTAHLLMEDANQMTFFHAFSTAGKDGQQSQIACTLIDYVLVE